MARVTDLSGNGYRSSARSGGNRPNRQMRIRRRRRRKRRRERREAQQAAQAAAQEQTPTIPTLNTESVSNPVTRPASTEIPKSTVQTLFPSTRMFEPENYEGSPLYKFQVKQGQDQLAKSLAARGLTDSGFAIEKELEIPLRAAAQDTDRMTRVASENADRLATFQNNEALRLERAGNNQWNRLFDITSLLTQESPWQAALGGLDTFATTFGNKGKAQANFLKNYYQKVIPTPSGGGGGGGGTPRPPIPVPAGPDYSNITPSQIAGDYSSNTNWYNALAKAVSSLF